MSAKGLLKLLGLVAVIAFPWYPFIKHSQVVNADLAAEYALIAISLVILTGWVGQISLAQGSFVGIGAFVTGLLIRNWNIPFPANLPIVAILTATVAALLGLVALRVRGLYLAVATLIFAWGCDAYLFTSSWLVGQGGYGIQTAAALGRLAAALVAGEALPADIADMGVRASTLSPGRFSLSPPAPSAS